MLEIITIDGFCWEVNANGEIVEARHTEIATMFANLEAAEADSLSL